MCKYRLSLSYDGSPFKGWQVQPNAPSVQGLLQKTLHTVLGQSTSVVGAGRTDAGVHAMCQVAHFETSLSLPLHFVETANQLLPPTIRVLSTKRVSSHFHARFSAKKKTYRYQIAIGPICNPFEPRYRTFLTEKLNRQAMQKALKFFIGTHDFSAFTNRLQPSRCPIKTIHSISYVPENERCFYLEFEGDGFLYKMVRNIVAALIYVGKNKISWEAIPSLLDARNRRSLPPPAPPQGLFLISVSY